MKRALFLLIFSAIISSHFCQGQTKTENIIIVTLDGYRWREVYRGASPKLLEVSKNKRKNNRKALEFWDDNPDKRRRLLMPFLWSEVVNHGVLYGNRDFGCKVNVANKYWFSYPGYNEILTGNPTKEINSNSLGPNPNITVLEEINAIPAFRNKVAVFSSWKNFNNIVNEERSGIYVNSSFSVIPKQLTTPAQMNIESVYDLMPKIFGDVRYDGLTFMQAFEHLIKHRPRVLMIALDETDEFGHKGQYEQYLKSANRADRLIEKLWTWIQSDSSYRDKTTLIITTDHGRGTGIGWKNHGQFVLHSNETWIAMLGPEIISHGEIKQKGKYYNAQIAATIASLLGVNYDQNNPRYACINNCVASNSNIIALKPINFSIK
jgi:hypothetical protein